MGGDWGRGENNAFDLPIPGLSSLDRNAKHVWVTSLWCPSPLQVLFPVLLSIANYNFFHWLRFKNASEDVQKLSVAAVAIPRALFLAVNRK